MSVTRVAETPRVTKPYDDRNGAASWPPASGSTGALAAGDVRLTMGGEPTFRKCTHG